MHSCSAYMYTTITNMLIGTDMQACIPASLHNSRHSGHSQFRLTHGAAHEMIKPAPSVVVLCIGGQGSLASLMGLGALQHHVQLLVQRVIAEAHAQVGDIGLVDVIALRPRPPVMRAHPVLLYLPCTPGAREQQAGNELCGWDECSSWT